MKRDQPTKRPRFGENTFSFDLMRKFLPSEFYDKLMHAIRDQQPISLETADVIAHAMREWACSRGATHYTHWFQPLTGHAAEKHQSFLDFDDMGNPIERFSGQELISSEPDASSFPHGGLRSTFEARGYTSWDPSSPAFLTENQRSTVLCLPSVFVSHTGEVLDTKTPLLRSVAVVSTAAVRMLRLLGKKGVAKVIPHVGAEQEYFLVDRQLFLQRLDLRELETTLMGAPPARGQQFEDHYFRAIGQRALEFMEEIEEELIRLGVPVKTRHNEVAPTQFELALIHRPANIAADHNQLVVEVLRRVAPRHGLKVLLHEKPYAHINGSGKHNNWSLIDQAGNNLLQPGTSRSTHIRFLVFLMAVVWGVTRHNALLSAISASSSNDLRLGGNEAPPVIMSIHLGSHLSTLLNDLVDRPLARLQDPEEIDLGLGGIARIPKDNTDRNRTSPFAFTGNKFEFRAVGSSATIALPNAVINAIVAEALDLMSDRLEEHLATGQSRTTAVLKVLREAIRETEHCRFDGDCYSEEWAAEAARRGLAAPSNTPEALEALISPETLKLFADAGILTPGEMKARHRVRLDLYTKTVSVELHLMRQMLTTEILPATLRYQKQVADVLKSTRLALDRDAPELAGQRRHLERIITLNNELADQLAILARDADALENLSEIRGRAIHCAEEVRPHIAAARSVTDQLEKLVARELWPLPTYNDLLRLT